MNAIFLSWRSVLVRIIRFAYPALLSANCNRFLQFQAKTEKSVTGLAGYRDERPWRVTHLCVRIERYGCLLALEAASLRVRQPSPATICLNGHRVREGVALAAALIARRLYRRLPRAACCRCSSASRRAPRRRCGTACSSSRWRGGPCGTWCTSARHAAACAG